MPANLENSAVATGLEKLSFHSNLKEGQCQRMFRLTTQLHSSSLLPTNPGGQTLAKLELPGWGLSGLSRWDLYEILSPLD